ncbi:hypothetical protein [Janthinobacterium sp. JC611]|uniref:hypothetical protein n=1 Tax=Janthinobacterium sp. JC611 TaxID=2816201 RepID=UPI00203AD1DF|nr:hypothetical protein [Janthinobacterium sp. JC611]
MAARTTALSAFAVCCVFAASLASAQNQPPPRRDEQQQMQAQRYEQVQRSNSNDTRLREQRDARSFDTRAEEQRRANEGADASRRTGRMTADERRDLRRQINEVGQDIYSNPPRR